MHRSLLASSHVFKLSGMIPSDIASLDILRKCLRIPEHKLFEITQISRHFSSEILYLDSNRLSGTLPAKGIGSLQLLRKCMHPDFWLESQNYQIS
jgi:hypothetical protein